MLFFFFLTSSLLVIINWEWVQVGIVKIYIEYLYFVFFFFFFFMKSFLRIEIFNPFFFVEKMRDLALRRCLEHTRNVKKALYKYNYNTNKKRYWSRWVTFLGAVGRWKVEKDLVMAVRVSIVGKGTFVLLWPLTGFCPSFYVMLYIYSLLKFDLKKSCFRL